MKANNFCWILVGLICLSQIAHSRRLHISKSSGIKEKRQSGGYSSPGGYANVASGGYSAAKSNDSENDVDATTTVVYDETNKDEEGTSEDYQFMTTQNPSEDEAEGGYGGGSSSSEKASSGGYGSPASSPVSGGYGSPASASRAMVSGGYDYTPTKMSDAEEDNDAEASTDKMMTEGEEMMTGRPLDQQQLENFNYPQQTSLEVPMARGGYSSHVAESGANYNTFNNYGPPPPNNYGPPARDNSNAVGGYGPAVSNNYGAPPAQQMYMAPLQQQGNKAAASAPATPQNATSPAPQNYYSNTNEIVPQPTSYLPAPMMNAYRYQTMQYQPHFNGPEEVKPQVIPSIGYYLPPVQQQQQQGRALEEPQQDIQQQQQAYGPPQPQNTYDGRNSAPAVYSPPGAADSQNQVGQQNLAGQPRLEEQGQLQNSYTSPPSQPEQARQQESSSNEYGPPQPVSPAPRAPAGFQLDFEEFHDNDNVVDAELIQRVQEIIAEHERQQKELREKLRREYAATEAAFFANGQQQQYGPPQQGFAPQGQYGAPAQPETYQAPQHNQQQFAQQRDPQNQQYGSPKEQQKTLAEYGVPEQRSQPEVQYAQREQQQPGQYGPPQQEQQQRQQQYGTPKEQQNQYRQPENQYNLAPQQESEARKPVQKYQQQPAVEYGQPEVKSAGQEEYNAPAPQQYNSPAEQQQDGQNSVYGPPAIQGREIDFDRQNSNQADQQTNSRKAPKRYQHFELQKAILKDHFVDTLPGNQYSSSGPQLGNQPSSNYPSPAADAGVPAQAYGVAGKQSEQALPEQNYHQVHHQQQQHHLPGEQEQLRSVPQFNQQTPLAVYGSLGFSNQGNVISMPDFSLLTGYNVHPTPTAFTHLPHEQVQQQPQSHYPQPQNSYHQQQSQGQSFPTSNTQAIILQQIPTAYSTSAPAANSGNPSDFSSVQYGVPASAAATAGSGPSAGQDVQSAGHPQQSTQTSPPSAGYSVAEQDQQDQEQHSFSSPQSYNQQLDQFVNPTYAPVQPRDEQQHQQQQIGYVFPQTSSFIPQSAYGAGPESLTTLNQILTSSPKPVYGIPLAPALGPEAFAQSSPSAPSPTAPTTAFDQPRFAPQPQHQMYEPVTFSQAQFAYQQQPSPSYGVSPFTQQQNRPHHHQQQLALSSPSAPSYPQTSSELEQQQQPLWSSQTASAESNQGQHNSDQDGHLNSITVPSQAYGLRTVPDVLNVNNNNVASHNQLYESSSPSGHQAQGGYSRFPRRSGKSRKVVRKNVRRSTTTTTEKTA